MQNILYNEDMHPLKGLNSNKLTTNTTGTVIFREVMLHELIMDLERNVHYLVPVFHFLFQRMFRS